MISTSNVTLRVGKKALFEDVSIKFIEGNCYGLIGANGAGKSTFLRILSGQLEPTNGEVIITPGQRLSFLQQDHFKYDAYPVLDTVIMGNARLYEIMKEKEAIYMKEDFSEEDGVKAAELEGEFATMNGWEAESDAANLLNGLGIETDLHYKQMADLTGAQKVKVLLAQALFGNPDILLLDEPTNHLDLDAIAWLEEFLINFENTVIVVSHDRYFLNKVCTQIADIDYGKIQLYAGNYDFWYESSQLMIKQMKEANKKKEEKIKELQEFISRFSANKSKSKQATARRKLLEKITLEEIPASSRRYPWVAFSPDREVGKDILFVTDVSKTIDGVKVLDKVSFIVGHGDKIAFVGDNEAGATALFRILVGEIEPDEGSFKWGVTISQSYFPKDNTAYFENFDGSLIDWLRQYSSDQTETYLRGFLGRMLFSGDEVYKPVKVLSGGEKVRCMLSRMMLSGANVLMLDQPTNHLDLKSVEWLEAYINRFKGAVLTISHDRYFLDRTVTRIIEVLDGKAEFYSGNYSFYAVEKERRYQEKLKQYEKEQAKIEQLQAAADKLHLWAFMGNDALHKRAFSMEKRIQRMRTTEKPTKAKKMDARFASRQFKGDEVLQVKGVSKAFDGRTLFSDIYLRVEDGERIALIGENGTGKTTLLNMLLGLEPTDSGIFKLGPSVKAAYLPQIIHFDHPERSILDTMLYEKKGMTAQSARNRLAAYQFQGEDVFKPVSVLSGGELSRITLAIKNAMADKDAVPTVIYDEIDSGVSGKAAGRIGEVLRQSAQGHQILCITHTAQIAALADCHLLIQKNVANDRTYTEIHPLDEEGRVEALARLISGDHVTELSRANAREMLGLGAK